MLYLFLIGFIVVAAVLLCFIVLIQNSKGGGLASSFSSSNQIMGVRKTTDVLEKVTWGLAAFIVVLSIASAYTLPSVNTSNTSVIQQRALEEEKTNPLTTPGFGAPAAGEEVQAPLETPATPEAE